MPAFKENVSPYSQAIDANGDKPFKTSYILSVNVYIESRFIRNL